VADARSGKTDALRPDPKPLSARLRSSATTGFAKARARLPLAWVQECFRQLAQALAALVASTPESLPVRLLDGSTLRLRPHGDIPRHFPPHRTRRRQAYWCVARVRLTGARAKRLAAGQRLRPGLDLLVNWTASAHDQVDRGLEKESVAGRLVVVRVARRGWRTQTPMLFTTLTDATAYPLVRGLMGVAARVCGGAVEELSFAAARTILFGALGWLWLGWMPRRRRGEELERVCREVGRRNRARSITRRKCSRRCGARTPRRASSSKNPTGKVSGIGLGNLRYARNTHLHQTESRLGTVSHQVRNAVQRGISRSGSGPVGACRRGHRSRPGRWCAWRVGFQI